MPYRLLPLVFLAVAWTAAGCGGGAPPEGAVEIDLDKKSEERLLRHWFGGYLGPEAGDPFEAGLLAADGDRYYLFPARLPEPWQDALGAAAADGLLDWDEAGAFLEATYGEARGLPETLAALREAVPYGEPDSAWFSVEIDGVMTEARRRVFVPLPAMRSALAGYHERGERLIYPVGTTLVGEHWLDGARAEVTAMTKRPDGEWDFYVYGRDGRLARATETGPRPLRSPTQCVGCHVGSRLFEPEKSFPAEAGRGPYGPRAVHTAVRDADGVADVVAFFDEHAKRSDTVLGIYNTLFVTELLQRRAVGRLSAEDAALLDGLRLEDGE
ncbi:MAG: hypothetical protein R3362_09745 [Rhodothermales bacterium]|nr:hypothetical protein [Rhodothermales bacterium]